MCLPAPAAALPSCGDANGAAGVNATDSLIVLRRAVGSPVTCAACACDVNADAAVTASDALAVLKRAVGVTRFLSCFAGEACADPQPHLTGTAETVEALALLELETNGAEEGEAHRVRYFSSAASAVELPALLVAPGMIATAAPPPAGSAPARLQVLVGTGSATAASNVIAAPSISPLPVPPQPVGFVTRDFLAGAVVRSQELIEEIQNRGDAAFSATADALEESIAALQQLDALVASAAAGNPTPLGTLHGDTLVLTSAQVAQVDAMILGLLRARAGNVDAAAVGAASTTALPRASGLCGQAQADAYIQDLLSDNPTGNARPGYGSAPCTAQAFNKGFAVAQGSAAVATGVMAVAGAPAIALALPAAAVTYITVVGSNGLIAVGAALSEGSQAGIALIKQGVEMVESSLRSMLQSAVLPEMAGKVAEMATAVYELAGAFTSPPPPTTTVTTTSSSSTSTTSGGGPGCYCCCAYWDGVNQPFYCLESPTPQQPTNGEIAVCNYYPPDFCGTGFCED